MKRLDISKILFYTIFITSVLGMSFAFGLYSGYKQTGFFRAIDALKDTVEESWNLVFEEAPTFLKVHPTHYLQPARYEGEGVTVNNVPDGDDELILLSGFFNGTNQLLLIQRDGTVLARWSVHFAKIFPDPSHLPEAPKTDWNIDIHGALALPDGSVVFNFESAGLVKLDRCGSIVWTLARMTHHSVELSERGGFWVPGRHFYPKGGDSPFPPFGTPLLEDTIMRVSEDGKVIEEISVPKLFYDNSLEALLTATGHSFRPKQKWDHEIVHLNKVEELSSAIAQDFPMFEAGDLAISIRELNLVMVVNPQTGKIKWWRIGPWLRQHDPEFKEGGKLIVFNNNIYRTVLSLSPKDKSNLLVPPVSNIVEIDLNSNEYRIIYGSRKGQEMLSVIRGKVELTPNGGLFVTEFEGGRVFETDVAGHIVWEYINRYDSDEVAEITEARIYPASYFSVSDWSCE